MCFSTIRLAIGAAQVPPPPCAFSIYTATAICGLFFGAKQINTEWSSPMFSAVPVLPQTAISSIFALFAVPPAELSGHSAAPAVAYFPLRQIEVC